MAGNTPRARSSGNLLRDSDPDDDTANDNSLDTAYLLLRTHEHWLAPLPFNTIRISGCPRALGHTQVLTRVARTPVPLPPKPTRVRQPVS
jgi:hypothetical protein